MKNEYIVGNWSRLYPQPTRAKRKQSATDKRGKAYTKPAALIAFENEYNEAEAARYANIPPECRVRVRFTDKTANELTRAIIAHLTFYGHFAARVNSTGVYDQRRGLWRTSHAARGLADVSAVIAGRAVQLEIKAGRDRPRSDQMRVQAEVRAAGGIYEFIHNFTEYIQLYNSLTQPQPP